MKFTLLMMTAMCLDARSSGGDAKPPIRLTLGFCWGALMALQANGDAELGVRAGYQAFELHGAHGYLLTSFLSPFTNQRDIVGCIWVTRWVVVKL